MDKKLKSKSSLQILGIWLKGKLERSGALTKYEPVTKETLEEYGNNQISIYKMEDGKYFITF